MARIIPVIDVMGGAIVRAVGGRRDEYRPLTSIIATSTDPTQAAKAVMAAVGADEVYVADLDAIVGRPPSAFEVVRSLAEAGFDVSVDAGVRGPGDGREYIKARARLVIGTETACGPDVVRAWRDEGVEPVVSLDLSAGWLLGNWEAWGAGHACDVAGMARAILQTGVRTLIVLDLAGVGWSHGPVTADTCRAIHRDFPGWIAGGGRLISGGGVRDWGDIALLEQAGVDGVLVASALHDGSLMLRPKVL